MMSECPSILDIIDYYLIGIYFLGHVGAPAPCNHVKLVDVDEMGYYAKNGQGEVQERS